MRQETGRDAFEWAVQAAELGAGELLVTSVDVEGTGKGFNLELTRRIADSVSIPVIACGGAGCVAHVHEVAVHGRADAVSVASILHYDYVRTNETSADASEGNTEFLRRKGAFGKIQPASLVEIKRHLAEHDIACRTVAA